MDEGAEILRARDLGRRLGERWIWRHVDLPLRAGDRLALVGPTGSGKSLLLRALAGLDATDEGEIAFRGKPLDHRAMPRFRAQVVYLLQRAAFADGTVEENLRIPFAFKVRAGAAFDRDRAVGLLRALGRGPEFLGLAAGQLSGGEAQIAALVRALQLDPTVLLLDEATSALDPAGVERAEQLVAAWLAGQPGRACVWTSHDERQLARVAGRRFDLSEHVP